MRTYLDCIPCFIRQALESARMVDENEAMHERVLRSVLLTTAKMDLQQCPPAMACQIHRIIREETANDDPYREVKGSFNAFALRLLPNLRDIVRTSSDPFDAAVRLAIAGNIIDFGVTSELSEESVHQSIHWSLNAPIDGDALKALRAAVPSAAKILYLADNAGEIVFDRLLLELLPPGHVVVAVKARPVINDATVADAVAAGMTDVAHVIDNGSDAPGTILSECSESFRREFDEADLIIAKGQGNYEALNDADREIFFMFKAKCPVIARHVGCEIGALVLSHQELPG